MGSSQYKKHVIVEFGRGRDLEDPHGVLEGCGKMRRHIKLFTLTDITAKFLERYVYAAYSNSNSQCR
ncbi:DUF1801 domain-containing protein [Chlorobium phaeobacteroides]|uniref:DUF1801 domain-containing protein n=1 Tax=Chlorobium phaeobacteroides TaxID=1096 RepID=UPI000053162F|nr:DUF1801 domain-containing protein [Chlorobium phaeobacteroides]